MIRWFSLFTVYLLAGCNSHIAVDNSSDENNASNTSPNLLSGNSINIIEFSSHIITKTQLQISDSEQSDSDLIYEIESLPTSGELTLNATPLVVGATFTQDDIENNLLSYVHKYDLANDTSPGSDSFVFNYTDGIGEKVSGNIVLLNIVNFCDDKNSATSFSAYGDGSDANPYLICTLAQLNSIGLDNSSWASSFKLKASINMSTLTGTSYNIIGNQSVKFTGNFDGRNNTLSNFNYSNVSGDYIAIFGSVGGVGKTIKNINMTNVNITGRNYVSALVAWGYFTDIHNISVEGNFACNDYCAGIIGTMRSSLLSFLAADIDMNSAGDSIGGVIGFLGYGTLENAFSKGEVIGKDKIGGIAGEATRSNIKNAFNMANVGGGSIISGIAADFSFGRLDNAFNTGMIIGYSPGNNYVGYIFGLYTGSSSNLYYDSTVTIANNGPGGTSNLNGSPTGIDTSLSPNYFYNKANPPLSSWDFADSWKENTSDYPSLAPTKLASDWGSCSDHSTGTPFAGGVGTPLNPYIICTATQLNQIGLDSSYFDKHFILKDNIDMSEISGNYNIIGSSANPFRGSFTGHSYTISNLTINESSSDVGLIGYALQGLIQGVRLESVNITGLDNTGGLIGSSITPVNIAFSSVTGSVSGQNYTGGLIGLMSRGSVLNVYNQATVNGQNYVGGLAGGSTLGSAIIAASYSSGAITGQSEVGGLVGGLTGSNDISYSFSAGAITGTGTNVGQLHGTDAAYTLNEVYIDEDALCSGCVHTRGTNIDTGSAPNYFFTKTNNPLSTWNFGVIWQENTGTFPTLQN